MTLRLLNIESDRYDADATATLRTLGTVDDVVVDDHPALVAALATAPYDVLVTRLGVAVDAAAMDAAPNLRWIVTPTTGLDHIDLMETERRSVTVISLRGEGEFLDRIRPTAEHTWALLLAVVRSLPAAHQHVVEGGWDRAPFLARELDGATLAVIGCGRLGRMVAAYGVAFGMEVLVHDTDAGALARAPEGAHPASADEALARADVVTLHLPLEPATAGWLSAERIATMRQGAVLVNTARGELIDERALLAALTSGHLAGAGIDVVAGDARWAGRSPEDHPLVNYARHHANLVMTPHVGGYGREAIRRTRRFVAEKLALAVAADDSNTAT